MRPCLAEHAHHPREYRVGPGAYVERLRQPRLIDIDVARRAGAAPAAATPAIRLAVDTIPSFAPNIDARSQPIRSMTWASMCRRDMGFPSIV